MQDKTQEIIEDLASEIRRKKREASPAERTRIEFRDGIANNREEIVYKVPLDLLLFRRENGRISSSVKTHERIVGPLDRTDAQAQSKLRDFLRQKDPEKTDDLKRLLLADGQREPGIITADGFLINGNRRKVALLELRDEFPSNDRFQTMKVVILPGENDEGGPPTLKEIEQIENRYQLQTEGKAEYHGFDAALSMRDKEDKGYSLEQQMRDDPQYRVMSQGEFGRALRKRRKDMLDPLDCVDEYLEAIGRPGEYAAVSRGLGDPEGRWQAFVDLETSFGARARTDKGRSEMGVDADEAGQIMQAAYAIIRARTVPRFGKLHTIMRKLRTYTKHGKSHLLDLNRNIKHELTIEERTDKDGEDLSRDVREEKWKAKYLPEITRRLVKAREASDSGTQQDAPMTLLSDALKKLNHGNMHTEKIERSALNDALVLVNEIKERSEEIKRALYTRIKTSQRVGMLSRD